MYRSSIITPSGAYRLLCGTAALVLAVSPIAFTPSTALADGHGSGGENAGGSGSGGENAGGSGSGGENAGGENAGGGGSEAEASAGGSGAGSGGSGSGGDNAGGAGSGGSGSGGDNAGGTNAGGTGSGDLYGDLFVILRDEDGIPILNDDGFVQPLDADGNLIPLDEEGKPIDESLTIEVDIGRLNVGRSPEDVLDTRTEEVVAVLSAATEISQDAAGRLVLTIDGVEQTIDSPLENLAIYTALLTTGSISTLTPNDVVGTEYDFLVDGKFTIEDLEASSSFLAAATDKTGAFTSDEIAYIDAFLGINTVTVGDVTYSDIDYSSFDYDRSDTYDGVMVDVLVYNDVTGVWEEQTVDIYTTVFGDTDVTVGGSLDAYTQAAEDARMVIEYIHEYEIPE
jgi:hypothetical protein